MAGLPQRLRPPLLDLLLALALVVVVEVEVASEHLHPYAAGVPLLALFVGVLAWRRRLPFLAVLVGFAAMLIAAAAGVSQHKPFSPILVVFVALYSLALYATPRRAAVGLVYAIGCAYLEIAFAMHYGESYGGTDFGFIAVLLLAPWLVGKAMRGRVADMSLLEVRAERAEREREQRAREAAREERARIARGASCVASPAPTSAARPCSRSMVSGRSSPATCSPRSARRLASSAPSRSPGWPASTPSSTSRARAAAAATSPRPAHRICAGRSSKPPCTPRPAPVASSAER